MSSYSCSSAKWADHSFSALHRPWFSISLSSNVDPLLSAEALSFSTCVSSARKHTQIMNSLLKQCPEAAKTWWFFSCKLSTSALFAFYRGLITAVHTFTAAVIQATILLRQATCVMAADIQEDFDASFSVMSRTMETSTVAKRSASILLRLRDRIEDRQREPNDQTSVVDP